jgi:prepilin-type N-terminal cleavage/methylation domain-containing protein
MQAGFTLLEIVVTLIVASILGVILLEFMGTTVQKSYVPIQMAQNSMNVNQIMERMNADYKKRLLLSADPLVDFLADVENGNDNSGLPYYGDYSVETSWILFDTNGNQINGAADQRILRVKVTYNNRSVTSLFTR